MAKCGKAHPAHEFVSIERLLELGRGLAGKGGSACCVWRLKYEGCHMEKHGT